MPSGLLPRSVTSSGEGLQAQLMQHRGHAPVKVSSHSVADVVPQLGLRSPRFRPVLESGR